MRIVGVVILSFTLLGCASWWTDRVDRKEREIAVLEQEREEAATEEEREGIDKKIERKEKEVDQSVEGAQEEQKNKQALLMALISIGVGGLKLAAGTAAKAV